MEDIILHVHSVWDVNDLFPIIFHKISIHVASATR